MLNNHMSDRDSKLINEAYVQIVLNEKYEYLFNHYKNLVDSDVEIYGRKMKSGEMSDYLVKGELLEVKPNGLQILHKKIEPSNIFGILGEYDDEIFIPFNQIASAANSPEVMSDAPRSKSGNKKYSKKMDEYSDLESKWNESPYEKSERIKNTKFPWVKEMEDKNDDIMNNIIYLEDSDELRYSIALLPDYVEKTDAIEFAQKIYPNVKKGMDYKDATVGGLKSYEFSRIKEIIGEELKSYDISLENVQTGYWDLVLTVENASEEAPNKLIRAFDLFYKGVEYLFGEQNEFLSSLGFK